jgi:hypothetical protein
MSRRASHTSGIQFIQADAAWRRGQALDRFC